jgi:alpha-tubulin suppressor-like RCC1 family protein
VSAGQFHVLALRFDGTVWAWGSNVAGELGDGDPSSTFNPRPKPVPGLTGIVQVAAGDFFSMALHSNGTVWAWGGPMTTTRWVTTARRVVPSRGPLAHLLPEAIPFDGVVQIAAGADQSTAILADGTLWTWGDNRSGELGTGATDSFSTVPVRVPALAGVTSVSAGLGFDVAVGLPTFVTVPDVTGQFQSTADNVLTEANLAVQVEFFEDGGCISIGRVRSQNPPAGTVVARGSTVTIRVGQKPDHRCP